MKKLWIPLSYGVNDTQAMSELFERFAKKGWHFDKLYGTGVLFIKGEKQACAYAVDLFSLKRKNNDDEQLQEYYDFCAQSGWEFADGYDQYQVFKAAEGAEPIPLQSDDEVAFDILYQQRIREIGHSVYEALSTILLLFLAYCLFPLDFYTDDLFLMIGILTPVLGCLILLRQAFRYVKMRQVKKAVAQGKPYAFTNHLLSRSIRDFTVLLLCIGFLAGYMLFKYLRHEQLPGTIYYVIALVNLLLIGRYVKRNGGRTLKPKTYVKIFCISFIGCSLLFGILDHEFAASSHVEPSRVIRMTNVDEQGKFTKNSSYFVPYQCQYEALENDYQYRLYVARDLKSSETLFDELLKETTRGFKDAQSIKAALSRLNDEFTVSGYYLNDEHTDIIVHDNTSIIIIKSNLSFDDPYVIRQFNEQLSELDLP